MRAALLLLLGGCLTYPDGKRQEGALNCELLDACGELEALGYDLATCQQTAAAQEVSANGCPAFDAAAMDACLDAYRAAIDAKDCDADLTGTCDVCG